MKLLNQSLLYLSVPLLVILSIWSVIFYFNMLDEISDSIDDGLSNSKQLIIQRATSDSTVLHKNSFNESNYAIHEISISNAIAIRDRYSDTTLFMPDEKDMEPVRMLSSAFELNGKYYQLQVISSTVEEDDLIEDLFWSVVWLYFIMIAAMLFINKLTLQKLWEPFYAILKQLKTFRLDHSQKPADITTNIREFQALKSAADNLMLRSLETYNQQKQFTENAAHELQTPLAIAAGKLELLLENDKLPEEHAADIAQVLQMIERMIRLNKSLLLLTKIENRQFSASTAVSINQIVHQCLSDLEDFIHFRNVNIEIQETEQIEEKMDPALATILITNLIKNAIFHNKPGGTVTIDIQASVLTISNTGKEQPLNSEKIFKRFYKHAVDQASTGLGLAIVKAICDTYTFHLSYHFNQMHCFEIRFNKY
ncbi:MAG TPA: HAMP domain-containing sensor histidine kinase [Agriterribacter sp.]|nr:HAMP domain-containing sensor histidine kinase [Agriterribacter sp.]